MEKMLIIEGEMIHRVGYRPFLLTEALKRKKITNFEAENVKEDGKQKVIINMVGEEQKILEFVKFIKNNFPDHAKNCRVSLEEDKCPSEVMHINDFRDVLAVEQQNNIVQGGLEISNKIDALRRETDNNFKDMDKKYKLISEGMFAIVNELKETNKVLGERLEKAECKIEGTEINIERLLNILEKRG